MNRKAAWVIGLGASGVLAYGVWRAWCRGDAQRCASDDLAVTEASEDSFPASDAPSHTPMIGSRVGAR